MGKRKERRLAAISAVGRRVKLDLFAEPTGQKQENPLLLLGQYSDDELNDDTTTEPKNEVSDELAAVATKENGNMTESEVAESDEVQETILVDIKKLADESGAVTNTDGNASAENKNHPPDSVDLACSPGVSELQNADSSTDVWKVLVDEQTGRYYYWNTHTGETSWDVPVGFHVPLTIENSSGYIAEGDSVLASSITHTVSQSVEHYSSSTGVLGVSYPDALMVQSAVPLSQSDCDPSISSQFLGSESDDKNLSSINYNYSDGGEVDPDRLVKHGEFLIQRLNSAERSDDSVERQNWRLKCILEVETRVFDCKSLSSFGSALLPFWWHCYTQLKRIEDALNQEEPVRTESSENNDNNRASNSKDTPKPELPLTPEPPKDLNNSPKPDISADDQDSKSMDNPCGIVDGAVHECYAEDVDMDVDMEVDEELPAEQTRISTSVSEEDSVPPPPPDDWIPPPPPPEEDIIPPPPVEEPPPSKPEAYSSYSYPGQYIPSYPAPAFEYYTYSEPQPVAPGPCFDHLAATVSDVSLVQPVVYHDAPALLSTVSDASSSYVIKTDVPYSSLEVPSSSTAVSSDPSESCREELRNTSEGPAELCPSTSGVVQSSGSIPSSSAAQGKAPRVKKRSVAVAPSLRSNKKVSSLVDKWKAAKEELHGEDEDEPEDAVEVLERKRQKEIEQWKARQIASGEAQENANFVPLGGDWRERLKRRLKRRAVLDEAGALEGDEKKPDLVSFAKGLPSGWEVYWDESSKSVYYANKQTAKTSWTRPSS
ncbi:WW domain-containing protein isoform X2 [Wolffia australiana]